MALRGARRIGAACPHSARPAALPRLPAQRRHRQRRQRRPFTGAAAATPVELQVGTVLEIESLFDEEAVATFAAVSGDHNPIHLDAQYAATTTFGRPVVHGILVASMFSTVFASNIPGSIYREQNLQFKAPVFVGELVRATVTVLELQTIRRSGVRIATCETVCTVIEGLRATPLAIATVPGRVAVAGDAKVLCPMLIEIPDL